MEYIMTKRNNTNDEYLMHKGVKGMKWGYSDGKRTGKRTAAELSNVQKIRKKNGTAGTDIQADYDNANGMLKYLGISLDLHSDDNAVAKTMDVVDQMEAAKGTYKTQYDYLNAYMDKLASVGYDMAAAKAFVNQNKATFESIKPASNKDIDAGKPAEKADGTTKSETKSKSTSTKKSTKKSTKDSSKDSKSSSDSDKKKDTSSTKDEKKTTTSNSTTSTKSSAPIRLANAIKSSSTSTTKKSTSTSTSTNKKKKATTTVILNKNKPVVIKHSEEIQNEGILEHHGILGMKWGVRRYQNKDGSYTDAGRKRYFDKETVTNIDSKLRTTNNAVNNAKTINEVVDKQISSADKRQYKKKLSKMSNEDIKKEIAKAMPEYEAKVLRKALEEKYATIVDSPTTRNGEVIVKNVLDNIGNALTISLAATSLYLNIRALKE